MTATPFEHIPVTLIGGYLGAGKTSLLRHLLTHAGGERIAVLVNDFGALGLDAALVARRDAVTVTLTNGCVCCSIADDFGAALDAQVRSPAPPARIVVETSGVADPGKSARHAIGWPGVRLDAVVTVVDLETIRSRTTDRFVGSLVVRQIESADVLVANKCDRVDAPVRRSTTEWLARHAPRAALLEACHGRIAPAVVLGVRLHEPGRLPVLLADETVHDEHADHEDGDIARMRTGNEDIPFVRASCRTQEPFDRTALAAALDAIPRTVIRFKGLVRLREHPERPYLLQGVGRRWSLDPAPTHLPATLGVDEGSVIDLIGIGPAEPIERAARRIASIHQRCA